MPANLPYLTSNRNAPALFQRIAAAKAPDMFTQKYLEDTIGLKGSNDRKLISILKSLGFLEESGKPTPEYGKLKNKTLAQKAIAAGIRRAYAPLFQADENAYALDPDALKGLVAQVAGSDDGMTARIVSTFNTLVGEADFSEGGEPVEEPPPAKVNGVPQEVHEAPVAPVRRHAQSEFHFNIQVHLPSNGTEETYLNIFNALRRTFA
jgi:hypothetical protein